MPKKKSSASSMPEQAMSLALGAMFMAKDSATDLVNTLVEKGKVTAKDQAKLRKEMQKRGEKEYASLMKNLEKSMTAALHAMDIPSRKEFEALKRKVEGKKTVRRKAKKKK